MTPKRLLLFAIFFATAAAVAGGQQSPTITFVPHWLPQAQFAGYYVASDLGIYKKHGMDVKILRGGPNVSTPSLLAQGKVNFASMWLSNAIRLKAGGTDVVNLSQLINRSALMLVAKKSSGILAPQDMNGRKIGLWGGDFQIQPMAFFKKFDLKVSTVLQGSSINLFFFDGIDVTSAMWYNEYHTLLISGFRPDELTTFFFSDYGFNFPEDGIYCTAEFLATSPETCRRFVLATLDGWKHAFEHTEEAIDIVNRHIQEANLPVNKSHQRWMLARMKDLMFPGNKMDDFQRLSEADYLFVAASLKGSGSITAIPSYHSLYRPLVTGNAK